MKKFLALLLIAYPITVHAANCNPGTVCQPGDAVNVASSSIDKANFTTFRVTLAPGKSTGVNFDAPLGIEGNDPKMLLSFVLPKDLPDGIYLVQIQGKPKPQANDAATKNTKEGQPDTSMVTLADYKPNQIEVRQPSISAMSPLAAYRDEHGVNALTVVGSGFRKNATFYFTKLKTPDRCDQRTVDALKQKCYDLDVKSDREIALTFHSLDANADYYKGPHEFVINVDGIETNTSSLTLIKHGKNLPVTLALLGFLVIVTALYLALYAGRKSVEQTMGQKHYLTRALFLDVETYSYSLSKCQFYAWTAAAVFGYLFLFASKSYVQGSLTFPDIPSGLPGILIASAGTGILAAGITSAKGNKGAGNPVPNFSDFIATGGLVVADRLQFAVWTAVGILTFLTIVLMTDPRDINDLPSIPPGFLELMGISAAGYIGGKLARKPGPTIDAISISGKPSEKSPGKPKELSFLLTGSGLSRSASFSIGDEPIYPDTIRGKEGDDASKLPEVVQQDPTIGDPDFARILHVRVIQPRDSWLGGTTPLNFTITNPDKQRATKPFQIFKVTDVKISRNHKLAITGEFLDKNLKVEYPNPHKHGELIEVSSPESPDASHYTANVDADLKGPVKLKVSDTAGVAVEEDVKVEVA